MSKYTLETPVSNIHFEEYNTRIQRVLSVNGIITIGDLYENISELFRFHHLGEKAIRIILDFLSENTISTSSETDDKQIDKQIDWEGRRYNIAKELLSVICANDNFLFLADSEKVNKAISLADEFIYKLQERSK